MPIQRMLPNAAHISEFSSARSGAHYNGTCMLASSAMALTSALGLSTTPQDIVDLMVAMRDAMFARGECASNGAATIAACAKELRLRGADILTEWDYQEPLQQDWHALLLAHAGIHPIVLQVAQAFHLYDTSSHTEDAGVNYHGIFIAAIANEGYLVGDPNNPTVMQTFDIYPYAALLAAVPCGLIMLNMTHTAHPIIISGGSPTMHVPDNWHDDGTTLTAPNGHTFTQGFRDTVLNYAGGWDASDLPLDNGIGVLYGATHDCAKQNTIKHQLQWRNGAEISVLPVDNGELAATQQQLAEAQQQIADLKAQLQKALTAPPAAPLDAETQKALEIGRAAQQLKVALFG